MTLIELITFLVALLLMGYSFFHKIWTEYLRQRNPSKYEAIQKEKEAKLKRLLKTLEVESLENEESEEETLPLPQPPKMTSLHKTKEVEKPHRLLSDDFRFQAHLDQFKQKSSIEQRALPIDIQSPFEENYGNRLISSDLRSPLSQARKSYDSSRIQTMMAKKGARRWLIVAKEVIGLPRGFDPYSCDYHL